MAAVLGSGNLASAPDQYFAGHVIRATYGHALNHFLAASHHRIFERHDVADRSKDKMEMAGDKLARLLAIGDIKQGNRLAVPALRCSY